MLKNALRLVAGAIIVLALATALLLIWPLPEVPRPGLAGDFLIRNVTIVDVEAGVLREKQDVVVRDGRITAVAAAAAVPGRESLFAIDGTGRFLMPGLWDMHAHSLKISPHYQHPLLIANGVTGVREMSGCMSEPDSFFACSDDLDHWGKAVEDGTGLAPRFVLRSSFPINGGQGVPDGMPAYFHARDAAEARELAAFYAKAGVDSLKTYSDLSPAAYRALAAGAREHDLMLAGHRPVRVSLETMLAAGQDSVEHPRLFLFECYADAAAYRSLPDPLAAYTTEMRARFVDRQDPARCASLMQAMARSGTWWTPTLQVLKMSAFAGEPAFREDPRLTYIPYVFRQIMWTPDADRAVIHANDESGRNVYAEMYRMALEHVGQAHRAGVRMLAGTDGGDSYVFPGFAMHDELIELVSAGLSPADALRTATIDAARFSGKDRDFGSVEVGKVADLLLLDADPLADIRNIREIAGVFFSGRFYDRAALDRLLAFAERQAGSLRLNLRIAWQAVTSPIMRVQLAD